mgnify:CR=1 FL=1
MNLFSKFHVMLHMTFIWEHETILKPCFVYPFFPHQTIERSILGIGTCIIICHDFTAYGVDKSDKASYPAFTSNDQSTLRHQLRVERRMEMAKEHMRYTDIIFNSIFASAYVNNISA